MARHKLDQ